jgi:hypothetical protein
MVRGAPFPEKDSSYLKLRFSVLRSQLEAHIKNLLTKSHSLYNHDVAKIFSNQI